MWLSAEPRAKIEKYSTEGRCRDPVPSDWIGVDADGNYRGIMWISINEKAFVYVESAARAQLFPIVVSELLSEVLCFELLRKLESTIRGDEMPIVPPTILPDKRLGK